MSSPSPFQRARTPHAKQQREQAILDAARRLAVQRTIRDVTLTDIAAAVGMHKSGLLRYFETREQIFLTLTGQEWQRWSTEVRARLAELRTPAAAPAAAALASTLVARPLFCDLLAQTPLNLERNVSLGAARRFKLVALGESGAVARVLSDRLGLDQGAAKDVVATSTSMAGALWQMAAHGTDLRGLYAADPQLAHALVDVEPRLTAILTALVAGFSGCRAPSRACGSS